MNPDTQIIGQQTPFGASVGYYAPIPTDLYIRFNMEAALLMAYHKRLTLLCENPPSIFDRFKYALHAAEYGVWFDLWSSMWRQHRQTLMERSRLMKLLDFNSREDAKEYERLANSSPLIGKY